MSYTLNGPRWISRVKNRIMTFGAFLASCLLVSPDRATWGWSSDLSVGSPLTGGSGGYSKQEAFVGRSGIN